MSLFAIAAISICLLATSYLAEIVAPASNPCTPTSGTGGRGMNFALLQTCAMSWCRRPGG